MNDRDKRSISRRTGKLRDLLGPEACILQTSNLPEFISLVHETSDQWQREDG
jgi:hypothetical protein